MFVTDTIYLVCIAALDILKTCKYFLNQITIFIISKQMTRNTTTLKYIIFGIQIGSVSL